MLYTEYLKVAKKHLSACEQLLDSYICDLEEGYHGPNQNDVWLDIYYLAGYVIEGITVYLIYKLGKWNPPTPNKDIKAQYHFDFTNNYDIDFYPAGRRNNYNAFNNKYHISQHQFRENIDGVLRSHFEPDIRDIPYLDSQASIDIDIQTLLDEWEPELRYHYPDSKNGNASWSNLNSDKISRLIKTCKTIVKKANLI